MREWVYFISSRESKRIDAVKVMICIAVLFECIR